MDNQPVKPNLPQQPVTLNPGLNSQPASQPKPHELTDDQARSLLTLNNLGEEQTRSSKSFLIFVVVLIIALVSLTLFIESKNKVVSNKSTSSSSPFNSNGSVGSQTNYCRNPINALTYC